MRSPGGYAPLAELTDPWMLSVVGPPAAATRRWYAPVCCEAGERCGVVAGAALEAGSCAGCGAMRTTANLTPAP
jgi:hypothetical protein